MNRPIALAATIVAALWMTLPGRAADTPLQSAALAWDRGDYVAALTTYLKVLDAAPGPDDIEAIALQTGELFHTTELTADGAAPRFSPDGQQVAYETGAPLARTIRIVAADGTARTEFPGRGAAFSPDGSKLAYFKLTVTPELTAAQAALDTAAADERAARQATVTQLLAANTAIAVRDLASGRESILASEGLRAASLEVAADGSVWFAGTPSTGGTQIYSAAEGRPAKAETTGAGDKTPIDMNASGTALLYAVRAAGAPGGRGGGGGRGGPGGGAPTTFGLLTIADARSVTITGSAPSFSGDGRSFTYIAREGDENRVMVGSVSEPEKAAAARKGSERVDAPALSRDGSRVAFQLMTPATDWEVYVANRDGSGEVRVTRDIQHDILPRFITNDRLVAAVGEPRHRRSFLYELPSMKKTRLFHNNTVRTIAPEYEWVPSTDGTRLLVVSERDGNTVSPERGVYMLDLSTKVTREELRARVKQNLDAEQALRAKGQKMFAPIAGAVKQVVGEASVSRVYGYEKALYDFDSKYVSQPGNKLAAAYLLDRYKSFGYSPEYQPFEYRGRGNSPSGQTQNVVAVLKGTVNPELVYVVSSHYDSVAIGPGADDDSSGTAALLETARILAGHPQPATIIFASFTGEEAGLLGSREFVRRAVADKVKIVGALNNDMIGWANDYRLDNTIRYSNPGIRDVQHAAAMQFTNMITYDALYYKSTDAAAYYEAYGDIVGGIGSYPVLSNPHYHQSHDLLDTINHQLVTEVSKTTAATLMLLASSPSRLKDLKVTSFANGTASLTWTPSPETGVTGYIVAYGTASSPEAQQTRVVKAAATINGLKAGMMVSVKAVNAKGLEGWDWARVRIDDQFVVRQ